MNNFDNEVEKKVDYHGIFFTVLHVKRADVCHEIIYTMLERALEEDIKMLDGEFYYQFGHEGEMHDIYAIERMVYNINTLFLKKIHESRHSASYLPFLNLHIKRSKSYNNDTFYFNGLMKNEIKGEATYEIMIPDSEIEIVHELLTSNSEISEEEIRNIMKLYHVTDDQKEIYVFPNVTTIKGYHMKTGTPIRTISNWCENGKLKAKYEYGVWLIDIQD